MIVYLNIVKHIENLLFKSVTKLILLLICLVFCTPIFAQIDSSINIKTDSLNNIVKDSVQNVDSTNHKVDSAKSKFESMGIRISPDAPEHEVVSTARDSAIIDMETSNFYLYGNANVKQAEFDLKSGVVEYNQKDNIISAFPEYDTASKIISEQVFVQGQETFYFDSLRYNTNSKRALVRNARMQYGDAYINSYQVKRNPDQSIFGYKNVYTTCDLPHPHFGIYAKKIKVIPNKIAASGPANLQIADLPTPLMFPFGIFPINPEQKSGFILPTYNMGGERGLGLQRLGYYFDINKYIGASVLFDIFTRGSYGIYASTEYSKKYKYNGAFNFDYTYSKIGEDSDPNLVERKDFKIRWRHTVDQRAIPGQSFIANVDVGSGKYNRVNGLTADMQLNNIYTSSIAYSKNWIGRPFSFTAALRHNQSTQTGKVSVNIPDISFNVAQITPFQQKNRVGKTKWFEKITASYNLAAQNKYDFIDTTFSLNNINIKDFTNGIKHSANLSATYNVLRFINWNFSVPYNEYWNTKQTFLNYNPDRLRDDTSVRHGFFATRDFSVNSSLSTRIYGLKTFKKGKVVGLRHVITPSVNFRYMPGFSREPFDYYYKYRNNFGEENFKSPYEIYSPNLVQGPGNPLPNGSIGLSINNNLQMKVRTNDSTGTKNVNLIDGLSINADYNFFADSNNLSNIGFSGRTSILQKFNISFNGTLDPYAYKNGYRTKHYLVNTNSSLAKLRSFTVSLDFDLNGESTKNEESQDVEKRRSESEEFQRMLRNNGMAVYYDFNMPWSLRVSSSMNYSLVNKKSTGRDSAIYTPNLMVSGSVRFTPKMMFSFSTGYDFQNKKIGSTTFNLTRDLHCWQMLLNITPFGMYRNYNFTLNVKSSVLQDLKLTRRRSYQDNF